MDKTTSKGANQSPPEILPAPADPLVELEREICALEVGLRQVWRDLKILLAERPRELADAESEASS